MSVFNDTIEQGADYDLVLKYQDNGVPIPLTGCTAVLMARRTHSATTADITLTSSPAAGLTITEAAGRIDIHLSAAQTSAMSGTYVRQLELTWPSGVVNRLLDGKWTVSPEVVR